MKINLINGLPVTDIELIYNSHSMLLENVLLDTGCATTIFDTDLVENIGLVIDPLRGKSVRMFGIGGQSELCFQQPINRIEIDRFLVENFTLQLGMTSEPYGFSGILGVDFFIAANLNIDFNMMEVRAT
ncbi:MULTISPECIES: pepsin/retropepsin-like aspartic protease family protein [Paenibacillus]|uniref:aspartyl protease family protein n=1 Tax=Paenibacillus TaxID=44249 RepID=UPI00073EF1D1|nr:MULTISPECIES: aspartyl protease family protein [Paenibacillus]MDU4697973.1 aspartyl protease family protein [Paenibacillus sp.]